MIRSGLGTESYWNEWVAYRKGRLVREWEIIATPSKNPVYEAQYIFDTGLDHVCYLIAGYSSGLRVDGLVVDIFDSISAWELSNRLAAEICAEHGLEKCRDWNFSLANLNHYNWCFWMIGLALVLDLPEDQWSRLVALIGGEGEDVLLDRVIASRQTERKIGSRLLHLKPYGRLLNAVNAPKEEQPQLLRDFVEHWYLELKRPPPKNRRAPTVEPFWYTFGDPVTNPLKGGSYFGRWCIEAAAAVKAFGLDDSICLGHEHYPGDLLRPDGPTTHPVRADSSPTLFSRLFSFFWTSRTR